MAKKSGLGTLSGDGNLLNSSKIKPVKNLTQLRQGDKVSFYIRSNIELPHEPCGAMPINDIPNLNILGKPGRQFGDTVLYDPVQTKNYLSISDRYERSLSLVVAKIEERGKKTVYYFCASNSSTGYWEVEVGGGATYLRFTNPILTIICPRPFRLQDLIGVETDGESITYEQIQGRTTIISPASGDGSLNPFVSIIGVPSDTSPPILIKGDADGDVAVTDTLLIYTSPTSNYDGNSFSAVGEVRNPCYFPVVEFTPIAPNSVQVYAGQPLPITWKNPQCDTQFAFQYFLLSNTTGSYIPIAEFDLNDARIATLQPNTHYRLRTVFEVLGRQTAVDGDLIYLPFSTTSTINIFADDKKEAIAFSFVESTYTKLANPTITQLEYFDTYTSSNSFAFVETAYSAVYLSVQNLEESDTYESSNSFTFVSSTYSKSDLGGVIIG